jgi:hypothetical protein
MPKKWQDVFQDAVGGSLDALDGGLPYWLLECTPNPSGCSSVPLTLVAAAEEQAAAAAEEPAAAVAEEPAAAAAAEEQAAAAAAEEQAVAAAEEQAAAAETVSLSLRRARTVSHDFF